MEFIRANGIKYWPTPAESHDLNPIENLWHELKHVTFFGKMDTNAFPFKRRNRLPSVCIRLNGSFKHLNGLLIRLNKNASV